MKKIGAVFITLILGYGASTYVTEKIGLIIHDQGPAVKVTRVDSFDEAMQFSEGICRYTDDKWPDGGCSYRWVVCGKWVYETQSEGAKSIHTRNYNSIADAVMVVRTDSETWNKLTAYTLRTLVIELYKQNDYDFCLTHALVDPTRKEDPHEFIPWFEKMGLIWDDRPYGIRLDVPKEPNFKWVRI